MSRQAKIANTDKWFDFGDVTHEDAAIAMAERANVEADKVFVVTRDAETPAVEFPLTVEIVRAYRVTGLRGGM